MKKFVAKIGYEYYQVPLDQLAPLMNLARVLVRLDYKDYRTYRERPEQDPLVEAIELAEVEETVSEVFGT